MILTEPPSQLDDHPLAGLSHEQRDALRAQAFGRVLAAVALRMTGVRPGEEPDRVEPLPRIAPNNQTVFPHTGE